jgi:hypothetical protein
MHYKICIVKGCIWVTVASLVFSLQEDRKDLAIDRTEPRLLSVSLACILFPDFLRFLKSELYFETEMQGSTAAGAEWLSLADCVK